MITWGFACQLQDRTSGAGWPSLTCACNELLDPGHDVLPVGVLFERMQVHLDATKQELPLRVVADLQNLRSRPPYQPVINPLTQLIQPILLSVRIWRPGHGSMLCRGTAEEGNSRHFGKILDCKNVCRGLVIALSDPQCQTCIQIRQISSEKASEMQSTALLESNLSSGRRSPATWLQHVCLATVSELAFETDLVAFL
jgi:hypothetical protein